MNHTTRRFPRTSLQAWPGSEPGSIQGPYRPAEPSALTLLAIALTLALASTAAAAQQWVQVAQSDGDRYQILAGSGERATNRSGQPLTVVTGQVVEKGGGVRVYRWYVIDAHCDAGIGELVVLRPTGAHAFDAEYVQGGTSIASTIGGLVCQLRARLDTRSREPSAGAI